MTKPADILYRQIGGRNRTGFVTPAWFLPVNLSIVYQQALSTDLEY